MVIAQNKQLNPKVNITKPEVFFSSIEHKISPPERGKFETMVEYNKRTSGGIDTNSVTYLEVSLQIEIRDDPFVYDIESKKITFRGGKYKSADIARSMSEYDEYSTLEPEKYQGAPGTPVLISRNIIDLGEYTGSNAYGGKVSISKLRSFDYLLNFVNFPILPDTIYNRSLGQFSLSIYKKPKDAEKLSREVVLIVGVKPRFPFYGTFVIERIHKPTFKSPTELTSFVEIVDVQFVSLSLYNKKTKEIISVFKSERH